MSCWIGKQKGLSIIIYGGLLVCRSEHLSYIHLDVLFTMSQWILIRGGATEALAPAESLLVPGLAPCHLLNQNIIIGPYV